LKGRRWRGSRGQGLTELALIAPLFSALLLVFACWAHLALIRLALIQLTRDTSILLARDADHWLESPSLQQDEMRELAKQYPLLEKRYLDLDVEPMPLVGDMNPGSGYLGKLIAGATVHLRYHLQPRGLIGQIYPKGLDLEEWAAVQGDPWCNPMETAVKAFL
jgi:hypothetical protein